MTFSFKPAVRSDVGLLIGLAGASGSGKTFSAMRLAQGMAPRFCVIDTEAGRAKHYADQFQFDHGDLAPPFTPERYTEAIVAADEAGYGCIVVDSMSHEWAGDGGVLDMQISEFERLGNREAVKLLSWSKPKQSHKHMVQRLLQVRAHLILCFRAEEKVDMVKGDDGKMKIVPKTSSTGIDGWLPVCEKNLPYELTASILLMASKPGYPKPIKLQEQHRSLFPLDQPITEESGKRIAEWAKGSAPKTPASSVSSGQGETARTSSDADTLDPIGFVRKKLRDASMEGTEELGSVWDEIGKAMRLQFAQELDGFKKAAATADGIAKAKATIK